MKRESRSFTSRLGIRARVVLPLIAICLMLSSAGGWMIHCANDRQSRNHVTSRASAIAHAICHLAETTHDEVELQRFVAAMAAEQDVKLIVVASGDPLTVIGASKADWVGLPASLLPDQEHTARDLTRAIVTNEQHVEFEHDEEDSVDFTVPLRTRIRATNPLTWSKGAVMLHLDGRPHMRQQASSTAKLLAALFVITAIAAAAAYGLISFVVLRPARQIALVARQVADGERNVRVNSKHSDELGQLASDVDLMLEELVLRERIESQAKEEALSCQRQMESALAKLACSNLALDQHAIVAITDSRGVITYVNDKFCELSQYDRDELVGGTHRIVNSGYHPKTFWTNMWRTVLRGQPWHGEVCNRAKDGSRYWVDTTIVPYKDHQGRITKLVSVRTDVTARKTFEEELRQSQERFELAVRGSNDGIWDWDIKTGQVYYSARFKELLEYADDEFPNHLDSFRDHVHVDDSKATWKAVQRHLDADDPCDVTIRIRTKSGQWRWFRTKGVAVRDSEGMAYRMAGSISDITEIKNIQTQLANDATHDRLTGLANRVLLLERLEQAMDSMEHQSRRYALLYLDFDRFKLINDSMGHEAGDELLRQIAARLTQSLTGSDQIGDIYGDTTIARFGGDEFVVLLEDVSRPDDVPAVAQRLLQVLAQSYQIGGQEVKSTASIGLVLGSADCERVDDVVCAADMAMYEAKRNGKGRCVIFDDAMRRRRQLQAKLESEVSLAIEADQLRIKYEPIVELRSGTVQRLEVHVCWQHPLYGRIESSRFTPIADESGCASALTKWMLHNACRQLRDWRREYGDHSPASLSINLTRKQFFSPDLPDVVSAALDKFSVQPCWLQLELPESALVGNQTEAAQQIKRLRECGVAVAIDHFGAGTSSFTSLHRLSIDSLKIDRSMLADLKHSKQAASLIHGLAVIVRNIGISLTATGIDSVDQLIALQGLGCDLAQGEYFGPPMSAQHIMEFLLDHENSAYRVKGAASFAARWAEGLDGQAIADTVAWAASGNPDIMTPGG